jgi:hypothetical protein
MDQMNFSQLLSAVAELRGQLVSILITGREDVSEPVAVLIGTAGTVDMSGDSDSEHDGPRGVAFVPVEEESAAGMGRQGVYLRTVDFENASRIAGRLIVTLREVTLEIEPT